MGSQLLRMRWNISETSSLQDSKKKKKSEKFHSTLLAFTTSQTTAIS